MKNYKKLILNSLIDKYEGSSLYRGDNKVNINISYKFNKKTIPDYYNEHDYESKNEINEIVLNLEERDFLKIEWKKYQEGNIIDKLYLNIVSLDDIYKSLNRQPKQRLEYDARSIIDNYCNRNDFIGVFAKDMKLKLDEKKSIKKYFDIENIQDIKDILFALEKIVEVKDEIPKRIFSTRLFSDSKRFEKLESKIVSIMRNFGDYDEDIDILVEENVINNPGHVFLKGSGVFLCNKETIDLSKINGDIGLSTELINSLEIKHLNVFRILTIENLTTFHYYSPKDELVIYLGGYHNAIRRKFLKKIHEYNKKINFYHWGDIDLGGLRIINHLRNKAGINFKPLMMDKSTLECNIKHSKEIENKSYIDKLRKLLDNDSYKEFYEVIEYMIENKVTLEQEALDV